MDSADRFIASRVSSVALCTFCEDKKQGRSACSVRVSFVFFQPHIRARKPHCLGCYIFGHHVPKGPIYKQASYTISICTMSASGDREENTEPARG